MNDIRHVLLIILHTDLGIFVLYQFFSWYNPMAYDLYSLTHLCDQFMVITVDCRRLFPINLYI